MFISQGNAGLVKFCSVELFCNSSSIYAVSYVYLCVYSVSVVTEWIKLVFGKKGSQTSYFV